MKLFPLPQCIAGSAIGQQLVATNDTMAEWARITRSLLSLVPDFREIIYIRRELWSLQLNKRPPLNGQSLPAARLLHYCKERESRGKHDYDNEDEKLIGQLVGRAAFVGTDMEAIR